MLKFAAHLARKIVNPFPGLPALEAAIGRRIIDRIGSNESIPVQNHPLKGVLGDELLDLARLYPDPYCRNLRAKLSELNSVPVNEVIVDSGADSLILLALRARVNVGDAIVTSAGTYPTFKYFAEGVGARIVEVPYKDTSAGLQVDLKSLASSAVQSNAALVYLANPDNPTGHVHDADAITLLRKSLPAATTLLLDEAYIDFCPQHAIRTNQRTDPWQNTVQLRTLSKAYGMAGLRVGYGLGGAEWVDKADQIRPHFAINNLSAHLAERVLSASGFAAGLVGETVTLRDRLAAELRRRGADVLPSATNFVALRYPSRDEAAARQKVLQNPQRAFVTTPLLPTQASQHV